MGTSNRRSTDHPEETLDRVCPLCGETFEEKQFPRHRITLEDEAEDTQNRLVSRRLCHACWDSLYTPLMEDTRPDSSFPLTESDS